MIPLGANKQFAYSTNKRVVKYTRMSTYTKEEDEKIKKFVQKYKDTVVEIRSGKYNALQKITLTVKGT